MQGLEESAAREKEALTKLCQNHAEEISRVREEMGEQLTVERERLLNQIRELTIMNQHTSAEVRFLFAAH